MQRLSASSVIMMSTEGIPPLTDSACECYSMQASRETCQWEFTRAKAYWRKGMCSGSCILPLGELHKLQLTYIPSYKVLWGSGGVAGGKPVLPQVAWGQIAAGLLPRLCDMGEGHLILLNPTPVPWFPLLLKWE